MKNFEHYKRGYYMPPVQSTDWVNKEYIDKAPAWCSVDLRDGNQALIIPMSLDEKLEFFKELVRVGFKEIEVGFPAASETEYKFCRTLIEENLIPDDVTIQVLTQAREHIIKKTFEAIQGAKNVVVHLYNSTSYAQRTQVFKKSKEEILKIATDGAKLLNDMADQYGVNHQLSTHQRALPELKSTMHWKYAMQSSTSGSRHQSVRLLSTFLQRLRCHCHMFTQVRLST